MGCQTQAQIHIAGMPCCFFFVFGSFDVPQIKDCVMKDAVGYFVPYELKQSTGDIREVFTDLYKKFHVLSIDSNRSSIEALESICPTFDPVTIVEKTDY